MLRVKPKNGKRKRASFGLTVDLTGDDDAPHQLLSMHAGGSGSSAAAASSSASAAGGSGSSATAPLPTVPKKGAKSPKTKKRK